MKQKTWSSGSRWQRPAEHGSAWIWPLLVVIAAVAGSLGSIDAPGLYAALDKPAWAPPASWFGPVWTMLYGLMALAAWWLGRLPPSPVRQLALGLFAAQLAANALWSWLFFGARLGGLAMADLVLLWLLLASAVALAWRLSRAAALLLLPTLAWVSFAGALNLATWLGNPQLLGG